MLCVIVLKRFIPDAFMVETSKVRSPSFSFYLQALVAFFFTNMPLINSLSTIACVKPYRVVTLQLLSCLVPGRIRRFRSYYLPRKFVVTLQFHHEMPQKLIAKSSTNAYSRLFLSMEQLNELQVVLARRRSHRAMSYIHACCHP